MARWRRVAVAAVKQSLRLHGVAVSSPVSVADVCALLAQGDVQAFVASEGGIPVLQAFDDARLRREVEQGSAGSAELPPHADGASPRVHYAERILLLVGPEGDFTAGEVQKLIHAGAVIVGLGSHRLRTETAAMTMLSAYLLPPRHAPCTCTQHCCQQCVTRHDGCL